MLKRFAFQYENHWWFVLPNQYYGFDDTKFGLLYIYKINNNDKILTCIQVWLCGSDINNNLIWHFGCDAVIHEVSELMALQPLF